MPYVESIDFSNAKLETAFPCPEQGIRPVPFMPNLNVAAGTVVGQVTTASASEVQTITFSTGADAPTGGAFTLSIISADAASTLSTSALAYDISNADLAVAINALLEAAGYTGATAALTDGPAPANVAVTFGGTFADWDMPLMTATNNLTSTGTATVSVVGTSQGVHYGLFGPYDHTLSDGRQTALGIAQYSFTTDEEGRISYSSTGSSQWGPGMNEYNAPVYFKGRFFVSQLIGIDSYAVSQLGRLESGTLANNDGILSLI